MPPASSPAPRRAGGWSAGEPPWWTNAVVYQIYPRSFQDSDGDGIGDLRGIERRLDHLVALGVDVVWLSPVYRSPQDDNGYDISDYQDVDPMFGTLEDLDRLLAASHDRGLRVVMDLVVNHSSDEHAWFRASRSSRTDDKRDWYWWRPAREGMEPGTPGAEPTNWRSFFGGSAWEYDQATGEYFLHLFSRKQPDLNWENPDVRRAVHDMMTWWLDRGVDGFRMDVINLISKVPALPDGEVRYGAYGDGSPFYTSGPRVHEFLQEMHREVFAGRPEKLLTVGETPGVTIEDGVLFTDPERHEVDMVFQFEHVGIDHGESKWDVKPLRLTDLKATFGRWQAGLAERGWNSLYWNNHDQPRIVSRFGDDGVHRVASAKALALLLHLHRGTPYVYQGEELGMTNAGFTSIDQYQDIESLGHFHELVDAGVATEEQMLAALRAMSRDNARTPVQWDESEHAGFTTGTPWLAVNPNHAWFNAEAERADLGSVFHFYRRLIALRHDVPVVALGDFHLLLPEHEAVYAFTRALDLPYPVEGPDGVASAASTASRDELLVLVNVGGAEQEVPPEVLAGWEDAELLISTHDDAAGPRGGLASARSSVLRPWEGLVLRRS
ncbi:alpha-glucosidase [Oerskovia jenensis]|uniref:alpha-glucosidase n=1 Tax=Oerskovia jenensis TaxID=162169 RepID=UPI0027DBD123|nr:alpha-glucosidase [Oerskovia jenensis]